MVQCLMTIQAGKGSGLLKNLPWFMKAHVHCSKLIAICYTLGEDLDCFLKGGST